MNIRKEGLYYEPSKKLYWGELYFEDNGRKSAVLICASRNYLEDALDLTRHPSIEEAQEWFNAATEGWSNVGENIFDRPVHYKVYVVSSKGEDNGLKFLQEVVLDQ